MAITLGVVELLPPNETSAAGPMFGMARRRFAGKSLLEWVVRRMSDAEQLRQLYILTPDTEPCRTLAECAPPDVRLHFSTEGDSLSRLADFCQHHRCEGIVRLSVAQPFVDPALVDRLVISAHGSDYAAYHGESRDLACGSPVGVFAEYFSVTGILKADREARDAERQDPRQFFLAHPEMFLLKFLAVPKQLDRDDLRLLIETEEDWEHVQLVFDALGPECLDWQYITNLLDRQPGIRERMAERNREAMV